MKIPGSRADVSGPCRKCRCQTNLLVPAGMYVVVGKVHHCEGPSLVCETVGQMESNLVARS